MHLEYQQHYQRINVPEAVWKPNNEVTVFRIHVDLEDDNSAYKGTRKWFMIKDKKGNIYPRWNYASFWLMKNCWIHCEDALHVIYNFGLYLCENMNIICLKIYNEKYIC